MMKRGWGRFPFSLVLFTISLVLCSHVVKAQYTNVWAFGMNAGIDFNQNPPLPIKTSIRTSEGCATICDGNGRLQFYTDGTKVWNRDHKLMPGGSNLPGLSKNVTSSTQQGALIVPVPGTDRQYYIFSLASREEYEYKGKLFYSVVDMDMDNGFGDIVPDTKGKLLDSQLVEFMTAVTGDKCDFWLLVGSGALPFKAYNINVNGIAVSPVLSPGIGSLHSDSSEFANIDVSPDRHKLIINKWLPSSPEAILCKFDPMTGRASNPIFLSGIESGAYASCFSPDGSKLYIGAAGGAGQRGPFMAQYDVNVYDSAVICSSRTIVDERKVYHGAIRRAPDGKIYSVAARTTSLNVINNPNRAGIACDYNAFGFALQPGTSVEHGLPNHATIIKSIREARSSYDTVFCVQQYALQAKDSNALDYAWDDGTVGVERTVKSAGKYWVQYRGNQDSSCIVKYYTDTFHVFFQESRLHTTSTSIVARCLMDTILLLPVIPNLQDYVWQDNSTYEYKESYKSGVYTVRYRIDSLCTDYVDSFVVQFPLQNPRVSFRADTVICLGKRLVVSNTSDSAFDSFKWSFGDQQGSVLPDPYHLYQEAGEYTLCLVGTVNGICADTFVMQIIVDSPIAARFFMNRDSLCVGETLELRHTLADPSIRYLFWYLGDGSTIFSQQEEQRLQYAYDQEGRMSIQLKTKFRACPDHIYTDTVQIWPVPRVDLGDAESVCLQGSPIVLQNRHTLENGMYNYLWSTGDTTVSITATQPGHYSLHVSSLVMGCSNSETVILQKGCFAQVPNTFSPNGDGYNDYFFPQALLTSGVRHFHMCIRNRWGQLLFETRGMDGMGWDGRFNGKEQPEEVYIYIIQIELNNGKVEVLEGNVTLLR